MKRINLLTSKNHGHETIESNYTCAIKMELEQALCYIQGEDFVVDVRFTCPLVSDPTQTTVVRREARIALHYLPEKQVIALREHGTLPGFTHQLFKAACCDAMRHEIDEFTEIDGVRIHDPHKED